MYRWHTISDVSMKHEDIMRSKLKPFFSQHHLRLLLTAYHHQSLLIFTKLNFRGKKHFGFILDSNLAMKHNAIRVCLVAYYKLKRISSARIYFTEDATSNAGYFLRIAKIKLLRCFSDEHPSLFSGWCRKSRLPLHNAINNAHLS